MAKVKSNLEKKGAASVPENGKKANAVEIKMYTLAIEKANESQRKVVTQAREKVCCI